MHRIPSMSSLRCVETYLCAYRDSERERMKRALDCFCSVYLEGDNDEELLLTGHEPTCLASTPIWGLQTSRFARWLRRRPTTHRGRHKRRIAEIPRSFYPDSLV